jgi:16S rRNA (guanine(966)-N(2))-methyltransferase RsmD
MRVITGSARGRKLKTLDSLDIRPTPDAVKEAIFSAIQFDLQGANVLDLFAGSGQLGIEALSRGAAHCVFVDKNQEAISVIKENLNACKLAENSRVLHMDSLEYIQVAKPILDIVLMDPPYRNGLLEKALPLTEKKLKPGAIVVCEHESELTLEDSFGELQVYKRYRYGKVSVTIYKMPSDDEELA